MTLDIDISILLSFLCPFSSVMSGCLASSSRLHCAILSQARNSGTPSISRGANHGVTEMQNLLNAPFVFQWLGSRSMIYWLQVLEGVIVSWSFYKFLIYQFSIEMFEKHWVSLHLLNSFDSVYCMIGNDWLDTHIQCKKYPLSWGSRSPF